MVDYIRTVLAKAGFKDWSADDVQALLRRGVESLKSKREGAETGQPKFSLEGTPEDRLRAAYEKVLARNKGFPDVDISEVIKEAGLPVNKGKVMLHDLYQQGKIQLSGGDASLASPEKRAAGIKTHADYPPKLLMKFEPKEGAPKFSIEGEKDFIEQVGKPTLREAGKVFKAAKDSGKLNKAAVDAAVDFLKKKDPTIDEQKARELFESVFKKPAVPPSEPVPEPVGVEVPPKLEERDVPTDEAAAPKDTTALKREVVDTEGKARGAEQIPTETRPKDEQIVADAKARSDADPMLAKKLVSDIVDDGKTGITEQDAQPRCWSNAGGSVMKAG